MKKVINIFLSIMMILSLVNINSVKATEANTSLEFISLSVDKTEIKAGDAVTFTVEVEDSEEVSRIEIYIDNLTPGKYSNIFLVYQEDNRYVGSMDITEDYINGVYKITGIAMFDEYNKIIKQYLNSEIYSEDNLEGSYSSNDIIFVDLSHANFTLTDGIDPDIENPKLISLSVDKSEVLAGDTVTFTVIATDNIAISGVYLYLYDVSPYHTGWIHCEHIEGNKYVGTIETNENYVNGVYRVGYVEIHDINGNYDLYYEDFEGRDFSHANITVTNDKEIVDTNKPIFHSITCDNNNVTYGETIRFVVNAIDDSADILKYCVLTLQLENTNEYMTLTDNYIGNNQYEFVYTVKDNAKGLLGRWYITGLTIVDQSDNCLQIHNKEFEDSLDYELICDAVLDLSHCDVYIDEYIPITSITLNKTTLTLDIDASETLIATIDPNDTTDNKILIWTSSNPNVATVTDGKVTAVNTGTATITVKTSNGKTATCSVKVNNSITSISLDKTDLILGINDRYSLEAIYTPADTNESTFFDWISSDTNVATVSSFGTVKAVGIGNAVITVSTEGGKTATCNVTVIKPIKDIELNYTDIMLKVNETFNLTGFVLPSDTTEPKVITWISSNSSVATVDVNGKVTAVAPGTCTIIANAGNSITSECDIVVETEKTYDNTIIISENTTWNNVTIDKYVYIKEGCTLTLTGTNSFNKNIYVFGRLNNNGELKANETIYCLNYGNYSAGNYNYGYLLNNGKLNVSKLVVKDYYLRLGVPSISNAIVSVTLNKTSLTLNKGNSETLYSTINPIDTTDTKTLTWSSSNENIVVVDQNGNVSGVSEGTAVITVTTSNGLSTTCTVTVKELDTFLFTDVGKGKWYYSIVKEAYEAGLMTGTSETTFSPDENMTRGMIVTVLHRIAGKPAAVYSGRFPDVSSKSYCAAAVEWAAANRVVSGYSNGKFGPNDNITRQDVAVILHNYAKSLGIDTSNDTDLTKFKDYKNVSSYARPAIAWAVSVGILGGATDKDTGDIYLNPKNNATRAECAKMLLQASKIYK